MDSSQGGLDQGVVVLFLELHGRKITECRVQSASVVYLVNEAGKSGDRESSALCTGMLRRVCDLDHSGLRRTHFQSLLCGFDAMIQGQLLAVNLAL